MKKIFFSVILTGIIFCFMIFQSCKEDTTPPNITITGSAEITIAKGASYTDEGATADDNKDNAVYVVSDYSATNPDMNTAGAYTITYTAQDRNANISKAERKVYVTWTGAQLAYNYTVTDTCINDTMQNTSYTSTAASVFGQPFETKFDNLMNFFSGNTYMSMKGAAITIPTQGPTGAPSQYIVSGTGTISSIPPNIIWSINYTVIDTVADTSTYRHAIFIY